MRYAILIGAFVIAGAIVGKGPLEQKINYLLGVPHFLGCVEESCLFLRGNGSWRSDTTVLSFVGPSGKLISYPMGSRVFKLGAP